MENSLLPPLLFAETYGIQKNSPSYSFIARVFKKSMTTLVQPFYDALLYKLCSCTAVQPNYVKKSCKPRNNFDIAEHLYRTSEHHCKLFIKSTPVLHIITGEKFEVRIRGPKSKHFHFY